MNDYDLMKIARDCGEDAPDPDEEYISEKSDSCENAQEFKARYKEFYSDIKTDIKEDW